MTEQCEHEWRRYIDHERYYALFICDKPDCNAELSMQEAEIVLNEHAALKRENKRLLKGIKMAHLHLLASRCECGEPLMETDAFDCLDALLTAEEQE